MRRRSGILAITRALFAMALLLVLVVGAPVVLARAVGWPLPTRLPTVEQLRDALGGSSIDDGTIVKTLAVVCWVAWLQVVSAASFEVHAWIRGTVSARVPLGGLVQPGVRRLVMSVALVLAGLRSAPLAPLPSVTVLPVAAVSVQPPPPSPAVGTEASVKEPATQAVSSAAGAIIVNPRDSLWRLAEHHLGDGMRWRELWELNRDRTFPDGRVFRNPDIIQPGWSLNCPPDAVGVVIMAPAEVAVTVAGASAEAPPAGPAASPSIPDVTTSSPVAAGPDAVTATPAVPSEVAVPERRVQAVELRPAPEDEGDRAFPLGLIAGSLTAAGLVALLDRLRRVQLRRRLPGHTPRPVPAVAMRETELRCAAADAPVQRLDLALRSLAGCLGTASRRPLPHISVVSVSEGAVEIVLSDRTDADPGPFGVSADGRAWTLPATAPPEEVEQWAAGQASPTPALVTVGAVGDRQVLIDLEASPRVLVTGDRGAARRTVWSMALEMTTSRWADDVELIVLAPDDATLDRLERATVTSDLDEVVERLERAAATTERDLSAAGSTSTLTRRIDNPGDPWTPIMLLVPEQLGKEDLQRLFELSVPGRGAAVVVVGEATANADHELRVEPRAVTLLPLGLRMDPASLPDELLEGVDELLATALSDDPGEDLLDLAAAGDPAPDDEDPPVPIPATSSVFVSVLGSVEVRGAERPIDRRRSLELVVYLALHPEGADEGRLRAVLWPESAPSRENFNQTVSRARQPLGHASDGTLHLPRLTDEDSARYHLGPDVTSDAGVLEAAYVAARRQGSDADCQHLASVLGLIRGIPFEGTKLGWHWTFTEGHTTHLASLAADAAHLVAGWALQRNDLQKALWAVSQGLRAAPGDEVLYRDRMQAHDKAGNIAGIEAAMEELRRTAEEGEPYDSVHRDTLAYYEQLTHRIPRTG